MNLEGVEIRDIEGADSQSRQGQKMRTADATQPRDGDSLAAQRFLFGFGDPAEVPDKRLTVRKHFVRVTKGRAPQAV